MTANCEITHEANETKRSWYVYRFSNVFFERFVMIIFKIFFKYFLNQDIFASYGALFQKDFYNFWIFQDNFEVRTLGVEFNPDWIEMGRFCLEVSSSNLVIQ